MQFNPPTLITIFRFALIPLFVFIFYLNIIYASFVCTLILLVAATTDWLDGYLARRWKQKTNFGAFLDPVADKIIVITAMVLIVEYYHDWYITLPTTMIIIREIIISALREWMAELGKRNNIAVSRIGKIKTTVQMIALVWMLSQLNASNISIKLIGISLLWFAATLTLWSMFQYLNISRTELLKHD